MGQISRAEYEQRFGRAGMRDPEYQAAVDNYLAALDFDDAYARFATQGLSHDDAVRAAQRMVHGRVRSDHPGPQGPQNVAAVEDFQRRQADQGRRQEEYMRRQAAQQAASQPRPSVRNLRTPEGQEYLYGAAAGGGGGNVPPVVPPVAAAAGGGGLPPRFAGARIAKALAASLMVTGGIAGMAMQGWNQE